MDIIRDAAQFLHETGLLGEINRVVLHPRGLALSIIAEMPGPNPFEERKAAGFGPLYDQRDDQGIVFGEAENASASARLRAREADGTVPVRPQREALLGFVVQPAPGDTPARPAPKAAQRRRKAAPVRRPAAASVKGKAKPTAAPRRAAAARRSGR